MPIACGGVAVLPGDVVVADANGVVVVPKADAEAVGRKAIEIAEGEKHKIQAMGEGKLIPEWLDQTLKDKGCTIV